MILNFISASIKLWFSSSKRARRVFRPSSVKKRALAVAREKAASLAEPDDSEDELGDIEEDEEHEEVQESDVVEELSENQKQEM